MEWRYSVTLTGRSLQLVYLSLGHAISDLQNELAVCPNIYDFERECEEIESLITEFEGLQEKVAKSKGFSYPIEVQA